MKIEPCRLISWEIMSQTEHGHQYSEGSENLKVAKGAYYYII